MMTIERYLCFSSTSRWAGPGEGRITLVTRGEVHQKNTKANEHPKWQGDKVQQNNTRTNKQKNDKVNSITFTRPRTLTFSCLWMSVSSTLHLVKEHVLLGSPHINCLSTRKWENAEVGHQPNLKRLFVTLFWKFIKQSPGQSAPLVPFKLRHLNEYF